MRSRGGSPARRATRGEQVPATLQAAVARIDAMAAEEHAKDKVGSATVGIVHGAHLIWTRSYGDADAERRIPATKDTVYRIGSITKQFTALMLMQLAQDGKVSFSATMTSGIGREPANLAKYLVGPVSQWEQTLIGALRHPCKDVRTGLTDRRAYLPVSM